MRATLQSSQISTGVRALASPTVPLPGQRLQRMARWLPIYCSVFTIKSFGARHRTWKRESASEGYKFFADSDDMLPYLIIEDKRYTDIKEADVRKDYATAYLVLTATCLLHQRLKLRAIGGIDTPLPCPEMVVHCLAMVGPDAYYIRVGIRGPLQARGKKTNLHFVRYEGETRGEFNLLRKAHRNHLKGLLRKIHAWGMGPNHKIQKEEVVNALRVFNVDADGYKAWRRWAFFTRATKHGGDGPSSSRLRPRLISKAHLYRKSL